MTESNGSQNIIITNADNFYERLDSLISKKIEGLKAALEEREAVPGEDRYVRDSRVEKKVISRRNIRYRWKSKAR